MKTNREIADELKKRIIRIFEFRTLDEDLLDEIILNTIDMATTQGEIKGRNESIDSAKAILRRGGR